MTTVTAPAVPAWALRYARLSGWMDRHYLAHVFGDITTAELDDAGQVHLAHLKALAIERRQP